MTSYVNMGLCAREIYFPWCMPEGLICVLVIGSVLSTTPNRFSRTIES